MSLLSEVHRMTVTALSEMRILLLELRPDAFTKVSLKQLFEQYLQPIQSRHGFQLMMVIDAEQPLPPTVKIAAYRIAQEALNNIDKHAKATIVHLVARDFPERLELTIRDNGTGFDVEQTRSTSLGLDIMRERAEGIGATLAIESKVGIGTEISLVWMRQNE